jgi:hypothetical protein
MLYNRYAFPSTPHSPMLVDAAVFTLNNLHATKMHPSLSFLEEPSGVPQDKDLTLFFLSDYFPSEPSELPSELPDDQAGAAHFQSALEQLTHAPSPWAQFFWTARY